MKTKFTKGKWSLSNEIGINQFRVEYFTIDFENANDSIDIYIDNRLKRKDGIAKAKADALLISKAPEMFEMLERILEFNVEDNPHISREIEQLLKEATEL